MEHPGDAVAERGVADMQELPILTDDSFCLNLRRRFERQQVPRDSEMMGNLGRMWKWAAGVTQRKACSGQWREDWLRHARLSAGRIAWALRPNLTPQDPHALC